MATLASRKFARMMPAVGGAIAGVWMGDPPEGSRSLSLSLKWIAKRERLEAEPAIPERKQLTKEMKLTIE